MTRKPTLTPATIRSAMMDTANASMRKAGRTVWSEEDYNAGVAESDRLYAILDATR